MGTRCPLLRQDDPCRAISTVVASRKGSGVAVWLPDTVGVARCRPGHRLGVAEEQMRIDELLAVRKREARRVAASAPFSPEWDAAMAALEALDQELRTRAGELNDAAPPRSSTTDNRLFRDDP